VTASPEEGPAEAGVAAVILAAGAGRRLTPFNAGRPKWLTPVVGRTIADRQLQALEGVLGPRDRVVVVGGHRIDDLHDWVTTRRSPLPVHVLRNDAYDSRNNWYSLLLALRHLDEQAWPGSLLVMNGDLCAPPSWYEPFVRRAATVRNGHGWVAVDTERALTDEAMKVALRRDGARLVCRRIGKVGVEGATAEYVGMASFDPGGWRLLHAVLETYVGEPTMEDAWYEAGFQELMERELLSAWAVADPAWVEIDDGADLACAERVVGP
jgi:choline kinase